MLLLFSEQSIFIVLESNVFKEVDEGKVLVENKKTVLEKNGIVVLDNSEKDEKIQAISAADEASTAYKEIKVYISQSTTPNQR
ncbi:15727_t:CDS:2 [Cetraspora pellucida]|uniref:15727_t:CDS:1 n=1 Tax=Cetraspora pellucida TaxID=1433469 RepID=A0A9N9N9H5_9GLOM|nr:15727_t:CDS:2 [Cetraspora pellucida]